MTITKARLLVQRQARVIDEINGDKKIDVPEGVNDFSKMSLEEFCSQMTQHFPGVDRAKLEQDWRRINGQAKTN